MEIKELLEKLGIAADKQEAAMQAENGYRHNQGALDDMGNKTYHVEKG